jgi:hypothetical protein
MSTSPDLIPDQRMLVQMITLVSGGSPRERALYRSVEWGAERMARRFLRGTYRSRQLLLGPQATLDRLVDALADAANEPGVRAVDLLVNPHGTSRRLWFVDGPVEASEVATRIESRLDPPARRRLRAAFSTACYGMSHGDAWLRSGFSVSVGARGIYADGLTSLPLLLRSWAAGGTAADAVAAANHARLRPRQDALAARYYRAIGRTKDADAVDSERVVDGARTMVVTSDPGTWHPHALPA